MDVLRESGLWRLLSSANISLPHQRRTMMQLLFAMIAGGTPVDREESEESEESDQPAEDDAVVSAAEISAIGQCVLGLVRAPRATSLSERSVGVAVGLVERLTPRPPSHPRRCSRCVSCWRLLESSAKRRVHCVKRTCARSCIGRRAISFARSWTR